jgi:hypothetical protein
VRIVVLTSLPRPTVLPDDFLPHVLVRARIPVAAVIARRVPLRQALRVHARTGDRGSRVLHALTRAFRSRFSGVRRPGASVLPRIPIRYVDDHNSPSGKALLRALEPDLLVLGATGVIGREILDIPRLGTLGCHYGLLPKLRGVNVIEWAILHDEPVGVSIFWVDAGVDTGDVVLQRRIPVTPGETIARLRRKSADAGKALLVEAVSMIVRGTAPRVPQRREDGKQFFTMHPRLLQLVEQKLAENIYAYTTQSGGVRA